MNYFYHLVIIYCIYVMLALSLDLLVGHLGLIIISQSAFFAIGAYVYSVLLTKSGIPVAIAITVSILVCIVLSIPLSIAARKLRGDAVVLASFAFLLLILDLIKNLRDFTKGLDGISNIPPLKIAGIEAISYHTYAFISIILTTMFVVIIRKYTEKTTGRFLHAIRDDIHLSLGIGISPMPYYLRTFTLSAVVSGFVGIVYASSMSFIHPNIFDVDKSILLLSMVFVGGAATRWGPILGAILLASIPEIISLWGGGTSFIGSINYLIMGSFLVLFVFVRPKGIVGGYEFK